MLTKQHVLFQLTLSVPQGSVFGPLGFAAYTEDVADVINWHSVLFQLYADDTQLHASSRPDDFSDLRQRLEACVADVAQWCASRHLQLNADKTETLPVASRANKTKLATQDQSLQICSETIKPTTVVRDLGVLLDSELSMKHHVTKLAAVCHYHLRHLRQIRRRVGMETTTRLVLAMITSRLDYCNSALAGLPQSTLDPLQWLHCRMLQHGLYSMLASRNTSHRTLSNCIGYQYTSTGAVQTVHSDARHPQQTMSSVPR